MTDSVSRLQDCASCGGAPCICARAAAMTGSRPRVRIRFVGTFAELISMLESLPQDSLVRDWFIEGNPPR